jgi:purine-binding chemotaxis protein CheW
MEAFHSSQPVGFAGTSRREMISFRVCEQEFCVDIAAVREIRGWTPATPLPQAPVYVCGVINLRGTVMPVIDLRRRLGFGATEPDGRNVIIVVQVHERPAGVLVDAVCETFVLDAAALQAPPLMGGDPSGQFVSAIASIEGRLMAVLNLSAILPVALEMLSDAA